MIYDSTLEPLIDEQRLAMAALGTGMPDSAPATGLPPTVFSVGTLDAVLDDTLFMEARWRAAGNESQLDDYPEAPHTFLALPTAMAAEGRRRIAQFLAGCLVS